MRVLSFYYFIPAFLTSSHFVSSIRSSYRTPRVAIFLGAFGLDVFPGTRCHDFFQPPVSLDRLSPPSRIWKLVLLLTCISAFQSRGTAASFQAQLLSSLALLSDGFWVFAFTLFSLPLLKLEVSHFSPRCLPLSGLAHIGVRV